MLNPFYFEYPLENSQASFASVIALSIFVVSLIFLYFGIFGKGDK